MTHYQQAKQELKQYKASIKTICIGDKPKLRMLLNDYTDGLTRNESILTDYQKTLLHNFCSKLHPKD